MCAMISGLFIESNDGRPPNPYKENLVSLRERLRFGRNLCQKQMVKYFHVCTSYLTVRLKI